LTWLFYGLIEFILAYVLPRFWTPGLEIEDWQWSSVALIFAKRARRLLDLAIDTEGFDALVLPASDVSSRALAVLEKLRGYGPFLFLNYMDTHFPYVPPTLWQGVLRTRPHGVCFFGLLGRVHVPLIV
jgi:hypothetical protein